MYAYGASLQFTIPTSTDSTAEGRESFRIRVRRQDQPNSEIVLEADILDNDTTWMRPLLSTVTYRYDFQDRLIHRAVVDSVNSGNNSSETFYYDGNQIVLRTLDGQVANRYIWSDMVDQLLADEQFDWSGPAPTSEVLYPLGDHVNTVRDVAKYDGTTTSLVKHITYNAFGQVIHDSDSSIESLFLHQGRYFDIATGLNYHHHRWYDPILQKWISEDPIGFAAGDTNLARMVGNHPTHAIDPSGLKEGSSRIIVDWILRDFNERLIGHFYGPNINKRVTGRWKFDNFESMQRILSDKLGIEAEEFRNSSEQLSRGCVGLAMFRLGYRFAFKKPAFPFQIEGSKMFTSLEAAHNYRKKVTTSTGKFYNIVAQQVHLDANGTGLGWKINENDPRAREDGEVFSNEITGYLDRNGMLTDLYNFSTYIMIDGQGVWEYFTEQWKCPDKDNPNPKYEVAVEYVITDKLPESYGKPIYIVAPMKE